MNDIENPLIGAENGCVHGTPVTFLEAAAFRFGFADVVFLNGHSVRSFVAKDTFERGAEIADAGGVWIIGIVGENVEHAAMQNGVALRERRAQIGIADGKNGQVGSENEIKPRRGLKQKLKIGFRVDFR